MASKKKNMDKDNDRPTDRYPRFDNNSADALKSKK